MSTHVSSVLSAAVAFVFPAYLMWFSSFADSWLTSRRSSGESDKGTWERMEWKRRRRGEAQGWAERIENVRGEKIIKVCLANGLIFTYPICWKNAFLTSKYLKWAFSPLLKPTTCTDMWNIFSRFPKTKIIVFFFSLYHIFSPHKWNYLKGSL